jgi:hypothetical protein
MARRRRPSAAATDAAATVSTGGVPARGAPAAGPPVAGTCAGPAGDDVAVAAGEPSRNTGDGKALRSRDWGVKGVADGVGDGGPEGSSRPMLVGSGTAVGRAVGGGVGSDVGSWLDVDVVELELDVEECVMVEASVVVELVDVEAVALGVGGGVSPTRPLAVGVPAGAVALAAAYAPEWIDELGADRSAAAATAITAATTSIPAVLRHRESARASRVMTAHPFHERAPASRGVGTGSRDFRL